MEYTFEFGPEEGLVFIRFSGEVTLQDLLSHLTDLHGHPAWVGGYKVLYDLSEVGEPELPFGELMDYAREVAEVPKEEKPLRVALVAPTGTAFGLLRMQRGQLAAVHPAMEVFRDFEAAREWLGLS